jgi:hypothetical protein
MFCSTAGFGQESDAIVGNAGQTRVPIIIPCVAHNCGQGGRDSTLQWFILFMGLLKLPIMLMQKIKIAFDCYCAV